MRRLQISKTRIQRVMWWRLRGSCRARFRHVESHRTVMPVTAEICQNRTLAGESNRLMEKRARPVTTSSVSPSASALSFGLLTLYLNSSTATQNGLSTIGPRKLFRTSFLFQTHRCLALDRSELRVVGAVPTCRSATVDTCLRSALIWRGVVLSRFTIMSVIRELSEWLRGHRRF